MVNKVENIITVINYIENNLTEKLNLSSIARVLVIQNIICIECLSKLLDCLYMTMYNADN